MRSLTCSPGWVQRAFNLLLLLVLTATSAGLLGLVSLRSAAAAPAKQDEQAVRTVNLELILDLSGSMARDIGGGETRMEAAKRVMNDVIDALPERGVNVGFRIYGHLATTPRPAGTSAVSRRTSSSLSRASTSPPFATRSRPRSRSAGRRSPLPAARWWRFSARRRGGKPYPARHRR